MKHDPHLANDLVVQSLVAKIEKLTARVAALEAAVRSPRARTVRRVASPEDAAKATPILQLEAARHGTSVVEICCLGRSSRAINARAAAAFALRESGMTSEVVGLVLGGRDHSSAIKLIARHKRRMGIE